MAAFPVLCVSTEIDENGTLGASSARGVRTTANGSHSSSHGVSRVSWPISRSRSSGDLASAAQIEEREQAVVPEGGVADRIQL